MAQTLDEFVAEAREQLARFEKHWREEHAKDPEHYPMQMETGNEGLWWEFLQTFDD